MREFFQTQTNEKRILACRHCDVKNRLSLQKALCEPSTLVCGACQKPLLIHGEEAFLGLSGRTYQHSLDREALRALEALPGFGTILRRLTSESFEHSERLHHFSSYIHSDGNPFPALYQPLEIATKRLDFPQVPELFITPHSLPIIYASGTSTPFITVSSGLIELVNEDELLFLFGREIGYLQNKHTFYKTVARLFHELTSSLKSTTFGLGSIALMPIRFALLKWERCAELTADRAGLLTSRNIEHALTTLSKLAIGSKTLHASLAPKAFLQQIRDLQKMSEESLRNRMFSMFQVANRKHPLLIWRTAELLQWAEGEKYIHILNGDYLRRDQMAWLTCSSCQAQYPNDHLHCPECGQANEHQEKQRTSRTETENIVQNMQGLFQQGGQIVQQGSQIFRQFIQSRTNPNANPNPKENEPKETDH